MALSGGMGLAVCDLSRAATMLHCDKQFIINRLLNGTPLNAFYSASFVAQAMIVIVLFISTFAVMISIMRKGRGCPRSKLLSTVGLTGLAIAGLGAGYECLNTWLDVSLWFSSRVLLTLPSLIEIAYILVLGTIVWGITAWGNAGARRAGSGRAYRYRYY